jgi:quinol monooxygenase YgiN
MSELDIIALFTPSAGCAQSVEDLLRAAVAPSRAEAGNVAYTVRRLEGTPARFAVLERYAGEEAWAAHREAPHIRRLLDQSKDLLAAPPEVLYLAPGEVG